MQHISVSADEAAVIGLQALSFIAGDGDMFGALLDQAGTDAADIRARASDPVFLGFVLDFLLQDDAAVIAFAGAQQMRPERVAMARRALPGGDTPEWT
jgi:hypothetical protein